MFMSVSFSYFFFMDPATTEIYTLSLHDALPIYVPRRRIVDDSAPRGALDHLSGCDALEFGIRRQVAGILHSQRSEEHTSELQSQSNLVCRLLLEKKKNT